MRTDWSTHLSALCPITRVWTRTVNLLFPQCSCLGSFHSEERLVIFFLDVDEGILGVPQLIL